MAFLDKSTRLLIYAKLKAEGYDVERLMSGGDFFRAVERALGRYNLQLLMEHVGAKAAAVEGALEAARNGVEAFLRFAGGVDDEVLEALGAKAALEANRGLGCPEPLARASALAKALVKFLSEEGRRLGEIEMELWELMVQQCAALAAAGRVYTVEET